MRNRADRHLHGGVTKEEKWLTGDLIPAALLGGSNPRACRLFALAVAALAAVLQEPSSPSLDSLRNAA
jgi:hypothetical protein